MWLLYFLLRAGPYGTSTRETNAQAVARLLFRTANADQPHAESEGRVNPYPLSVRHPARSGKTSGNYSPKSSTWNPTTPPKEEPPFLVGGFPY